MSISAYGNSGAGETSSVCLATCEILPSAERAYRMTSRLAVLEKPVLMR